MGIVKMITKREIALIFYQIPSTYSLRKCVEKDLESNKLTGLLA